MCRKHIEKIEGTLTHISMCLNAFIISSNFLRVLVYEYSWRRAREDYARRQAWSQLSLGDGKYVVLALLRVDGY